MKPFITLTAQHPDFAQLFNGVYEQVNALFKDRDFKLFDIIVMPGMSRLGQPVYNAAVIMEAQSQEALDEYNVFVSNVVKSQQGSNGLSMVP